MRKLAKFLAACWYVLLIVAVFTLPWFAINHHPLWWAAWAAVLGYGFWIVLVDHRRDEARRTVGIAIAEARLAALDYPTPARGVASIPLQRLRLHLTPGSVS